MLFFLNSMLLEMENLIAKKRGVIEVGWIAVGIAG